MEINREKDGKLLDMLGLSVTQIQEEQLDIQVCRKEKGPELGV
jgi:hypothetical protein